MSQKKPLKVVELFAGVGGFRVGLEMVKDKEGNPAYEFIWSNQWEPSTKIQHASNIYVARFGQKGHINNDIAQVSIKEIPDHDILVGGFPCQDYSVAKPLNQSNGIIGKKGVLWWQIHRILSKKKTKPSYLLLENVDRLLKSPASQRGRDFSVMLASLSDIGYCVEWRIINAADYGFPQRRRRIFIIGYHESSDIYKSIISRGNLQDWLFYSGVFAQAFPVHPPLVCPKFVIKGGLNKITKDFNKKIPHESPFENTGIMINREVYIANTRPLFDGRHTKLKDLLIEDKEVPEEYYIQKKDIPKWEYFKGAKHILRKSKKTGKTFKYDEGEMIFPDDVDRPSRTIVTGEGGSSPSRFKHVIRADDGRLRRLVPIELERLNMFPDNHTEGVSPTKRAFLMGNAIVVGIVERLGGQLINSIEKDYISLNQSVAYSF